jgi:hypothetical protein
MTTPYSPLNAEKFERSEKLITTSHFWQLKMAPCSSLKLEKFERSEKITGKKEKKTSQDASVHIPGTREIRAK